jgi:hypothetical protein
MVFFSIMFPRVFDALSAGSGTPVIDLTTFLGWLPCLLVGTGLSIVVYSLFRAVCYEPNQMQTTAYEEQLQLSLQIPILYERLRYCAADHRVFDPATQRMCHPDQDKIRTMLVDIALQADEKDQAPVT